MVLPSADMSRLTIDETNPVYNNGKYVVNDLRRLSADGNTIMNLPWFPRAFRPFLFGTYSFYILDFYAKILLT
jgi:hypothetical protein